MAQPLRPRPVPGRPATRPLIPRALEWWRATPAGAAWLDRLPRLVDECGAQWGLAVGGAYDAHVALVLRVDRRDGAPAVLKLNFPEEETEHEADALRAWPDDAAVTVLADDPDRSALLLERCDPGTPLWDVPEDDAVAVVLELLPRLYAAGDPGRPFRRLDELAPRWADTLEERWERTRPFERELLDEAAEALRELGPTQGPQVLCNEDFHGGNVLLSARGWLAIDPKPIVAEREFAPVSFVRDRRPVDAATVRARLDALSTGLGLDRERLRRWSLAHAIWWGLDEHGVHEEIVGAARVLTNP